LNFITNAGVGYIPRHNFPRCFPVGAPGQPDFTMDATPDTQTVEAGQGTSYDVALTSQFGFDSACTLTVDGLPAGATADFTVNPVTPTGGSVMNVTTTGATSPGNYTLTVTATEIAKAQIEHSTEVVLIVTQPPDFAIAIEPDSQEVQAGNSVNYDVILESLYGFASQCTLTISGLPTDASASFSPNPLVPTDTSDLQITTAQTTPEGSYTVTVTATEKDKGTEHSADLILVVTPPPDFAIAAEPDTQEVEPGNSVDYDVILTALYGFSNSVDLSASGLPADAVADFDPDPAVPTDTSLMTINTAATTPPGTYDITITGTEVVKGEKLEHSTRVVLKVLQPDFTIAVVPDSQEVQAGNLVNFDVILTSIYGFASSCTLTISGLPADASGNFNPNPVVPTDTAGLEVTTSETTPEGTYTVTVTATEQSKKIFHSADFKLVISPPPDFAIEAEPETLSVPQGGEDSFQVIVTSLFGFVSPCSLEVSGLPQYASGIFDPSILIPTDTSALNVSVPDTTLTGTYPLTITATELEPTKSQIQHSVEVVLEVRPPEDFTIDVFPDTLCVRRTVVDDTSYMVFLTSIAGFSSTCTLAVSGLPSGATGDFDPPVLVPTDSAELNIFADETVAEDYYDLTITATEITGGKAIEHSKDVVLLVVLPTWGFVLETDPDSQEVNVEDDALYDITMLPDVGFTMPCTLYLDSGLPGGASFSFVPEVIFPNQTSVLTVTTTGSTPEGVYELEIRGVANPKEEYGVSVALVTLVVQDFSISAPADTQYVTQGQSAGFDVELISLHGFDDPCTLMVSGLPDPPDSVEFDPATLVPPGNSHLTIYTTAETDTGLYALTITAASIASGKGESLQHSVNVFLKVTEASDVDDWTDNSNTPKGFALFQNQPNPFNPETKISYFLPQASHVELVVFNVLGQRVRTLFDGYQDAGTQTLIWDGRSDDGRQLSSGIYFYRLQSDNFQDTKKMTLMK
jgi:hypothetical protein